MKLLLLSDLHLDTPFAWASAHVARMRRQALRDTLSKILELAMETVPEAVLCGGDLYEYDRFSPDTGEFLRTMFERLYPIPVFIAPGNHDWYGPDSLYRRVKWSPNVHVFISDYLEPVTLSAGVTLWGAAHRAPATTDGFLEQFRVNRDGIHLALFHGSERRSFIAERKGKVLHAPFDAEQIERASLHHAFLGHYHQPRDANRHTYPGNPDPLTFGEEGERGVVIVTCQEDGTVLRERKRVAVSEVHDLQIDVTGCVSRQEALSRVAQALESLTGVARVTLEGELGTAVDLHADDLRREEISPALDAIVLRIGDVRVGYDFDTIARELTVRGQFVRDVIAANLSEEERRRVQITGLRALEGREDLEVL